MKTLIVTLSLAIVGIAYAGFSDIATAESMMDNMHTAAEMKVEGEIKQIDLQRGTVSIKHSNKDAQMPGMVMVYPVKEKSLFANIKVGDQVAIDLGRNQGAIQIFKITKLK